MKTNLIILIILGLLTNNNLFGQSFTTLTQYNFETIENITISNNGIWEIGTPSKTNFNAAFQGNRAIITDSINPLPVDTTSYFFIVIDSAEIQKGNTTMLEFWHKYELDETEDSAFIDFSYDGGISWYKGENSPNNYEIMYSRYFSSTGTEYLYPDTIISGISGEWVREIYVWFWYIPCSFIKSTSSDLYPDSILVRFNVKSGMPSEQKAGWMIDSLSISYDKYSSAIQEINLDYLLIYPNPFSDYITIELENSILSEYHIYNSIGQIIRYNSDINSQRHLIDTKELKTGLYFLKILDDKKNICVKPLIKY